jgi:hypothetical protein
MLLHVAAWAVIIFSIRAGRYRSWEYKITWCRSLLWLCEQVVLGCVCCRLSLLQVTFRGGRSLAFRATAHSEPCISTSGAHTFMACLVLLLAAGDRAAWQLIACWERPDAAGHLRLTVGLTTQHQAHNSDCCLRWLHVWCCCCCCCLPQVTWQRGSALRDGRGLMPRATFG